MRKSLYILLLVPSFILFAEGCTGKSTKKNASVDDQSTSSTAVLLNAESFESGIASNPDAQIVDVRTPEEFNEGYIKGAININYQDNSFATEIVKLDKNKPTYVYCRSGGRSSEACNFMSNQKFTKLYDLDGGISAWIHYKKPLEIPKQ